MREYLFELRKKAEKTQTEVNNFIREKLGVNVHYSRVEIGSRWSDLSINNRAEVLAEALNTTPEYILECEKKYGGYEGADFKADTYKPNFAKTRGRAEHKEPLTAEERAFAEQYFPYFNQKVDTLRRTTYRNFVGKIMTYEDFYDIGVLAFLRAIKTLSAKIADGSIILEDIETPDFYYKSFISRNIKAFYGNHIRNELTQKRKAFLYAAAMDAEITNGKGDSDANLYNFVPNNDIPVNKQGESSWFLDTLYRHLTDTQITACKLLISGWIANDIVKEKIASLTDIGIIRFYLEQFRVYGKIIWETDDYKSVAPNIRYIFKSNLWTVTVIYKGKTYSLGTYPDLNTALDLQADMHAHIDTGNFPLWYNEHLIPKGKVKIFSYPLESDLNSPHHNMQNQVVDEHIRWGSEIQAATRDNPVGVVYDKIKNHYRPVIARHHLGIFKNFDDALAIRQLAEQHMREGDFDSWYAEYKIQKAKK